jgi:hypothetical protein
MFFLIFFVFLGLIKMLAALPFGESAAMCGELTAQKKPPHAKKHGAAIVVFWKVFAIYARA